MPTEQPLHFLTKLDSRDELLTKLDLLDPSLSDAWQLGDTIFAYSQTTSNGKLELNAIRDGQLIATIPIVQASRAALQTTIDWLLQGGETFIGLTDFRTEPTPPRGVPAPTQNGTGQQSIATSSLGSGPSVLQQVSLFADLTAQELTALSNWWQIQTHPAGSIIFNESSLGTELYLIIDGCGQVLMRLPGEGPTAVIAQVEMHDIVGELALVDGHSRSATLIAVTDLTVGILPREVLLSLMEENPRIGHTLMRNLATILAGRLRETNRSMRVLLANQHQFRTRTPETGTIAASGSK